MKRGLSPSAYNWLIVGFVGIISICFVSCPEPECRISTNLSQVEFEVGKVWFSDRIHDLNEVVIDGDGFSKYSDGFGLRKKDNMLIIQVSSSYIVDRNEMIEFRFDWGFVTVYFERNGKNFTVHKVKAFLGN